MNENQIAEEYIDSEIKRRTGDLYLSVMHVTGISRRISGITVVSKTKLNYDTLLARIVNISYHLDEKYGDVFPGDMKIGLGQYYDSVAICDSRDQFSRIEGRIKAKRIWLTCHHFLCGLL